MVWMCWSKSEKKWYNFKQNIVYVREDIFISRLGISSPVVGFGLLADEEKKRI